MTTIDDSNKKTYYIHVNMDYTHTDIRYAWYVTDDLNWTPSTAGGSLMSGNTLTAWGAKRRAKRWIKGLKHKAKQTNRRAKRLGVTEYKVRM